MTVKLKLLASVCMIYTLFAGCSDSSTSTADTSLTDNVTFSVTGFHSGERSGYGEFFSSTGVINLWGVDVFDLENDSFTLKIDAQNFIPTSTGSYEIGGVESDFRADYREPGADILFSTSEEYTGTLQITTLTSSRVVGTFSFDGWAFDADGEIVTISIRDGKFDAPLVVN
ncbi:MAG: hypothetical protein LAT67_08660 [Balneolales bacterium]|nr:hypothetical protein [Balneolales bacterium]